MASHGAAAAAGSDATSVEVSGMCQTNQPAYPPVPSGDHSWSSSTGAATVSWNYPVDNQSQAAVYYDPQRDVSVSGDNQNVASSVPPVVQSTMGLTSATRRSKSTFRLRQDMEPTTTIISTTHGIMEAQKITMLSHTRTAHPLILV